MTSARAEGLQRLVDGMGQTQTNNDAGTAFVRPRSGANEGDTIDILNEIFAVIRVVNRVAILNEHLDEKDRPSFSLLSKDSFMLMLANYKMSAKRPDEDGKLITVQIPAAPYWLAHSKRRQYAGIAFAPSNPPSGYYNLWRGFALKPSQTGSCEKLKEHLLYNVCDDNSALYNWVFGWFADIFQNPTKKSGTALVLRGEMGVGKTIVGEIFGRLLGLHYVQVADPRFVTGRFNAHFVRCLLFHLDEGFWAGDKIAESKVKDLVTGKTHPIELKGFEVFFTPNYVRVFINGYPDWLVPAGLDERRFATLDVADTHKQDIPYFKAMIKELEDCGYAKLLQELLEFDLSLVDLRTIPKTAALLDQKIASLTPEQGWWLDILRNGHLPPHPRSRAGKCPGQFLYEHYLDRANKRGVRRRQLETALGIFLNNNVPKLKRYTDKFLVDPGNGFKAAEYHRGVIYEFPPLSVCREAFTAKLQQPFEWDELTDWIVPNE